MLKRKRSAEESVETKFSTFRNDLSRALKAAKGLERQRQGKRLRDSKATPEKTQRLQKEVVVLKSLDLHQAAHAHLCSSLLRIKAVAESPTLPAEIKTGVPKPDISEEERTALHNVTSALCNRKEVRAILDKAIPSICNALGVPVPEKKRGKGTKGSSDKRQDEGEQPADRSETAKPAKREKQSRDLAPGDVSDADEDRAIDRFEAMLGGSSSDDQSGSESDEEVDPMAATSDEEEWGGFEDTDKDSEENKTSDEAGESSTGEESSEDEESESLSPPPKRVAKLKPVSKLGGAADSMFLPSLMGGYISGSESASDVDIAPPRKNRRGQRERQAIWEKKYKDKAKHLSKESKNDVSWDPKRGAVMGTNTPWKRGIKSPFTKTAQPEGANSEPLRPRATERPRAAAKPQDSGPLHPSWEASKKAKEKQAAVFQGKKITFD